MDVVTTYYKQNGSYSAAAALTTYYEHVRISYFLGSIKVLNCSWCKQDIFYNITSLWNKRGAKWNNVSYTAMISFGGSNCNAMCNIMYVNPLIRICNIMILLNIWITCFVLLFIFLVCKKYLINLNTI